MDEPQNQAWRKSIKRGPILIHDVRMRFSWPANTQTYPFENFNPISHAHHLLNKSVINLSRIYKAEAILRHLTHPSLW